MRAIRLGGLLLLVLLAGSCQRHAGTKAQPSEPPPLQASVLTLQPQKSAGYVELTGTVAGAQSVSLSTKLMSQITELSVVEGQKVTAGQLLARIDDSDIVAMRNEAAAYRAEAAAAQAEVETVVAQGRAGKAQAEAAVAQAEAALTDARHEVERVTRLVEADTLPRVQKEKAELGLKVAEENVNKAHSGVEQADAAIKQAEARRPQVAAKEQQASAKDQQAAALQGYATLKAPFDGVITHKYFEAGQLSIPGQPILTIDSQSGFKVKLGIPEELAAGLQPGAAVSVLLDKAGVESEVPATLKVLGASADPASHLVSAELALEPAAGLLSGQFVRVRIPSGKSEKLLLPESAILREGESAFVWRLAAGELASRVPVELGESSAGQVEVLRGLSAGDRVLDSPPLGIYPGARIAAGSSAPANVAVPDAASQNAAQDGAE